MIVLNQLSVQYGKFLALDNISCSIQSKLVGVIGPNGAGKTTLLRTLVGLQCFRRGKVEILGIDVKKFPLEVRRRVGYVPEGEAYLPGISPIKFTTFSAELAGIPHSYALRRAHEVLEYIGLKEERYRKSEELSYGQRARLKLAQALCHGAELLILDEPTNGLDPIGRSEFISLLKEVHQNAGIYILLATHTLEEVENLCQEVIFLYNGKFLAFKKLEDITESQNQSYVVKLTGGIQNFLTLCKQKNIQARDHGSKKIFLQNIQNPSIIFHIAAQLNIGVVELKNWKPTLETIFLQLIDPPMNSQIEWK